MTMQPSISPLLLILALSWLEAFVMTGCIEECSPVCKCIVTDDRCEVLCTGRNLHEIPSPMPKNATVVDLSNNHLKTIPAMAFSKLKQMEILRIDDNNLESLHQDSFRGLTYLRELSLEGNNLRLRNETFATFIFVDLIRLRRLKLRRNNQFDGDYLDYSITKIHSLESLYIVGYSQRIFGLGYRNLKRLNYVSFSSENKPSIMKIIPEKAFQNLVGLKYLNLSYCKISEIHEKTFSYLSSLTVLDLSFNRNMTFFRLRQALHGLKGVTSLQYLNISAVHEVFGLGTEFTLEDTRNLETTSLKMLHMDSNKLELFEDGALSLLPKTLEYLSIRGNRFTFGWYIFEMYQLPNIRVLDISFLSSQHYLPFFDFWKNSTVYNLNIFNSHPITLEVILYRDCNLRYPVPNIELRSTNMVEYINASGNMLCPWQGPIKGLEKMTRLDLSNNLCQDVSNIFFSNFFSLRELHIHDNLLGNSKTVKGFNLLFQSLTKLESLKLSNNRIANMSKFSLINQVNIRYLDLSNNLLESFQLRIGHMRNLSTLDLSDNFLKSLSVETYKEIEHISSAQNISVNLMRNELACSCRYIRFFKWMLRIEQSKRIHLMYDKCIFSNGTFSSLKGDSLEKVVRYLDNSCSSFLSLILTTTILILVFIFLCLGGLVYRYRWNLRYFYYMIKDRYSNQMETAENCTFDAFVSYAEEDGPFVINQMLLELEGQGNLRLNIHQRDFVPGKQIIENILSAIQQSRFCLVLLSRAFLNSKWCMYEFSMAKMETIYAERDMVVIIMLEEVDVESIPLELMQHLKTKSYIEYPAENEQGQQLFWNHIRRLIARNG